MGIVGHAVRCAGCDGLFRLRLQVGPDPRQPFYLACPICAAPTRGVLEFHGSASTTLSLAAGEVVLDDAEGRPSLTISADIPSIPSSASMEERGGSPFIHFTQLIGIDQFKRSETIGIAIRENLAKYGPTLTRLTAYYRRADWKHFDKQLAQLAPEFSPDKSTGWWRDDVLHRLWEVLIAPLLYLDGADHFPQMKLQWSGLWIAASPGGAALKDFAQAEFRSAAFVACHHDLLSAVERYINAAVAILPGALANLVPPARQGDLSELRLFRDEFDQLRDQYVQGFEACHKALRWVVGAANAAQRGDPNAFLVSEPPEKKMPRSLKQYASFANARKRPYLLALDEWEQRWDRLWDRHLRNDFGHASARHDLSSGNVLRDRGAPLNYVRFLQHMHTSGHGLIACAEAMKAIRINAIAMDNAA